MRAAERPDYGYDAPGVIWTMFGVGMMLATIAAILLGLSRGRAWLAALGGLVALAALAPLFLGVVMVAYSRVGKLRVRDMMLDVAPWKGDERALDIGAGAGLLMIGAAKRLTTGRSIGVDIWSAKDLSGDARATIVRNSALEGVADRVEIRTEDARRLGLESGSIDRVFSLLCLHNIEPLADREQACREIVRVLKPGGLAVVGDYVPTRDYARVFAAEGLDVSERREFARALGPLWIVTARKLSE